jgi:energy-coupling factor transporter ATP-binding protein EcfA2
LGVRLVAVTVSAFKRVEASIEWAPLVVLFGPNDAGKTNLLEALATAFANAQSRSDPLMDWSQTDDDAGEEDISAFLELDLASPADRALLAELIQYGRADWSLGSERYVSFGSALNREQIRWGVGAHEALADGPAGLDHLHARLKEVLLDTAAMRCDDWAQVSEDYTTVVSAMVASRHLQVRYGEVRLAMYWQGGVPKPLRQAATRLLAQEAPWGDEKPWLFGTLERLSAGGAASIAWTTLGEDYSGQWPDLWNVVTFGTDVSLDAVVDEIELRLRAGLEPGGWAVPRQPDLVVRKDLPEFGGFKLDRVSIDEVRAKLSSRATDKWLTAGTDGGGPHPVIVAMCAELSELATRIAPEFVVRGHDVIVEALPPSQWAPNHGRRIRVARRNKETLEDYDISVVGSGVGMWITISVLEAMERLSRGTDEPAEGGVPLPETGDEEEFRLLRAPKMRLYLIDEPERHLHPVAQREVAEWITQLTTETGAPSVALATHAAPFLNLPVEAATYLRVWRDDERRTRAEPIDRATLGQLDELATRLGVSRADLVQLTRAVLVVEGKHDVMVLRHFLRPGSRPRKDRATSSRRHLRRPKPYRVALPTPTPSAISCHVRQLRPGLRVAGAQ